MRPCELGDERCFYLLGQGSPNTHTPGCTPLPGLCKRQAIVRTCAVLLVQMGVVHARACACRSHETVPSRWSVKLERLGTAVLDNQLTLWYIGSLNWPRV